MTRSWVRSRWAEATRCEKRLRGEIVGAEDDPAGRKVAHEELDNVGRKGRVGDGRRGGDARIEAQPREKVVTEARQTISQR